MRLGTGDSHASRGSSGRHNVIAHDKTSGFRGDEQRIPSLFHDVYQMKNPVSPVGTRTRLGEQCRRAIDVRSYSIFVSITGLFPKAQWQSLYYSSIGLMQ